MHAMPSGNNNLQVLKIQHNFEQVRWVGRHPKNCPLLEYSWASMELVSHVSADLFVTPVSRH